MEALEFNHRIEITSASTEELDIIKKACKVQFYRYSSGRRIHDRTENLLYKEDGNYYFPPGLLDFIASKLEKIGADIFLDDHRSEPMRHLRLKSKTSRPELFPNQKNALIETDKEENNQGYITSIMGSGKSRIIEEIVIQKSCNTLIVVPTESIRDAIYEQLLEVVPKKLISTKVPKEEDFFSVKEIVNNHDDFVPERVEDKYLLDKGFKKYGGNWYKVDKAKNELSLREKKKEENKENKKNKHNIVVCCYHSLREASLSFLHNVELFICDEGHTARNNTIRSALLNMPNAHYKYFLSATMWADLQEDMMLLMSAIGTNHVFEELPMDTLKANRVAKPEYIEKRSPVPSHPIGKWKRNSKNSESKIIHSKDFDTTVKLGLVGNSTRNDDVCETAIEEFMEGNRVLICINEEVHGHILRDILTEKWKQIQVNKIYGLKSKQLIEKLKELGMEYPQDEPIENLRYNLIQYLEKDFDPGYIFGQESKAIKKQLILETSYGHDACITIGTSAVGIGVDTKNINVVLLVDVRKSSTRTIQGIGRGSRIKNFEDQEKNYNFRVYNWLDWFHPKLMEHSRKRERMFKEYFLGEESITKKKWSKVY